MQGQWLCFYNPFSLNILQCQVNLQNTESNFNYNSFSSSRHSSSHLGVVILACYLQERSAIEIQISCASG